jgi:hypothetical protein
MQGSGCRVPNIGFGIQGLWFRDHPMVKGSGYEIQGMIK